MVLYDANPGENVIISEINLQEKTTRRLEMLGMTKGTKVSVLEKKRSGPMIIKVRGTRFALGRSFVKGIRTEKYE